MRPVAIVAIGLIAFLVLAAAFAVAWRCWAPRRGLLQSGLGPADDSLPPLSAWNRSQLDALKTAIGSHPEVLLVAIPDFHRNLPYTRTKDLGVPVVVALSPHPALGNTDPFIQQVTPDVACNKVQTMMLGRQTWSLQTYGPGNTRGVLKPAAGEPTLALYTTPPLSSLEIRAPPLSTSENKAISDLTKALGPYKTVTLVGHVGSHVYLPVPGHTVAVEQPKGISPHGQAVESIDFAAPVLVVLPPPKFTSDSTAWTKLGPNQNVPVSEAIETVKYIMQRTGPLNKQIEQDGGWFLNPMPKPVKSNPVGTLLTFGGSPSLALFESDLETLHIGIAKSVATTVTYDDSREIRF